LEQEAGPGNGLPQLLLFEQTRPSLTDKVGTFIDVTVFANVRWNQRRRTFRCRLGPTERCPVNARPARPPPDCNLAGALLFDRSFNTAEGWSRDVTKDIAEELRRRYVEFGEVSDSILDFMEANRR
jgi:hypothetical protein